MKSSDLVILDTGATVSIFCNESLLSDVHDEDEPIYITGITSEKVCTKRVGICKDLKYIKVYILKSLTINIVSF